MIALFNTFPWIVTLVMLYWGYARFRKTGYSNLQVLLAPFLVLALFWAVYMKLQPSYLPKGEIKRNSVPTFEQKDYEVKDLQPKPMKGEDRDERRKELYKEKLPFISDKTLDTDK